MTCTVYFLSAPNLLPSGTLGHVNYPLHLAHYTLNPALPTPSPKPSRFNLIMCSSAPAQNSPPNTFTPNTRAGKEKKQTDKPKVRLSSSEGLPASLFANTFQSIYIEHYSSRMSTGFTLSNFYRFGFIRQRLLFKCAAAKRMNDTAHIAPALICKSGRVDLSPSQWEKIKDLFRSRLISRRSLDSERQLDAITGRKQKKEMRQQ